MPNLQDSIYGNAITQAISNATQASEVDPDFQADVVAALMQQGLDLTRIPPDQFNALTTKLWNNADLQDNWSQYGEGGFGGIPSMTTQIRDTLFVPGKSTDPGLYAIGTGLRQSQGQHITSTEIAALGPEHQQVPTPFDPQYFGDTTLTFGQTGPFGAMEDGIDYAMPQGTALYTPFAGTIRTEDDHKSNWGKRVFVQLDNGYTFAIGHMTNFAVTDGERVNPGELLGESGGNPGDPSSGESNGDHVEVQWIGPDGQFQDPGPMLQKVYSGTTFSALDEAAAAGTGVSKADAKSRLLGIDPILNSKYPGFVSLWKKYFGGEPTVTQTLQMAAHGPDVNAVEDFIRSMGSHIQGMNVGQYFDLRTLVDQTMQKALGHAGTDGMVKELFDAGSTAPKEVEHFINHHAETALNAMGPQTYNTIYAANQPHLKSIYGETGFDPRTAILQHQQAGGQPATNTESSAASNDLGEFDVSGLTPLQQREATRDQ